MFTRLKNCAQEKFCRENRAIRVRFQSGFRILDETVYCLLVQAGKSKRLYKIVLMNERTV